MSLDRVVKLGYGMLIGTVAVIIYASLAQAQQSDQPGQEVNYPPCFFNPLCTCSKVVPDLGHVTCRDVPLSRIPRHINNSRVYILQLENNGLRHIEPYFLEGTNLYRIEISRNNLTDVTPEAFIGLERTLWEVDLHSNHLINVPSRAIRYLQKLRLLNLTDNEITDVAGENWRGVEDSLETLILRLNGISSLEPDAFSSLVNLQTLDLGGNALLELGPNVFHDGPPRLTHLILQDNALHTFPYQQVSNLRKLQHLDISRNQISQLQNMGEDGQNSRVSLTLDTLRIEYNQLNHLPPRAFENFQSINKTYLNGNPISVVEGEAFQGPKIKEIYLRDCGISELAPRAFSGLEASLVHLDLSGNNLTQLPQRLFHEFNFLQTLYLQDNFIIGLNPMDAFSGIQHSLIKLNMRVPRESMIAIQDLKRTRNLRSLTLSQLALPNLTPEDFREVGVDLRDLKISGSTIKGLKNHAFKNVQSLERLDLSENHFTSVDSDAFAEVGDSITNLNLASAFSGSLSTLPSEAFRHLTAVQRLDISNNHISTLPETSFHSMRNLQILHMQDNSIDSLPKGTFQGDIHSHLEKLFMSFNYLSTISTHSFVGLRRIDTLRIDDNKLSRIDKRAFMNLDKLKHLSLRGNKLNYIADEAFQNLPSLHELDLAYNDMRNFEFSCLDQVGTLSSFRLNVSHNSLRQLESNGTLYVTDRMRGGVIHTNIEELDFSHNNITNIGRWYFRAVESSLTHLHLAHNSLRNLTRELIGNIRHLQWLDVGHNRLEEIEYHTFKSTQNLQVFYAGHNNLKDLPPELFRGLGNLRVVDLSFNHLRMIPDLFFERGLETLRLNSNQLTRMPVNSFTTDAAVSIVQLDVSDNAISALHPPDVFAKFQSLQHLDLRKNRLVRLDEGAFSQLPTLFSLDLSDNMDLILDSRGSTFHGVEDSLQELYLRNLSMHMMPEILLPTLRYLDLADNHISVVPIDLPQNLSSLRTFDLSGNRLTSVPPAISKFTQLRSLSLARNPINSLVFTPGLRLRDLDIRHLPLDTFEVGTLGKLPTLRTLRLSPIVRDLNLPHLLQENPTLERLHIEVWDREGSSVVGQDMSGSLPFKLREMQISGRGVKSVSDNFLKGVRGPDLTWKVFNTSIESISQKVFYNLNVRSIRIDVRHNSMRILGNPNTAQQPGSPRKTFLMDLKMAENKWTCNCGIGWVEMWERKKRQYFCSEAWDSCQSHDDDLREIRCDNSQRQRLLDALKTEIECGWNSASTVKTTTLVLVTILAIIINS